MLHVSSLCSKLISHQRHCCLFLYFVLLSIDFHLLFFNGSILSISKFIAIGSGLLFSAFHYLRDPPLLCTIPLIPIPPRCIFNFFFSGFYLFPRIDRFHFFFFLHIIQLFLFFLPPLSFVSSFSFFSLIPSLYLFFYPRREIAQGVERRASKTEARRFHPGLSSLAVRP